MSEWAARRFWSEVTVLPESDGFAVLLDARQVRTPQKAPLSLPTRAFAEAVAAEWQAQEGVIDPSLMPLTRAANSAIDKLSAQRDEVIGLLADYGASDLLCYRAEAPEELVARQAAGWDPVLDWAAERFGARLAVTSGILPVAQDPALVAALRAPLETMSVFELAGAHDLIALSGSLVLAHAVLEEHLSPRIAWSLSRIDEDWQAELWGSDDEAAELAGKKAADYAVAAQVVLLSRA